MKATTPRVKMEHTLQVSFVSPVKVSDHTEYIVQNTLSGKTWQCQRRYKEFDELHNKLKRVNPDLPIPSLPTKKWFGNMAPKFVNERQAALQSYVDELLQDPRWASMHILRAFFDTHRHMNDAQQDNDGNGYGQGPSSNSNVDHPVPNTNDSAMVEAAMEAEDQRRDEIVERAEKLMVEIYAAPPVLDATAAAEQVEEVEDALSKRSEELVNALSTYRQSLLNIKGRAEAATGGSGGNGADGGDGGEQKAAQGEGVTGTENGGMSEEEVKTLMDKALGLMEDFRQENVVP